MPMITLVSASRWLDVTEPTDRQTMPFAMAQVMPTSKGNQMRKITIYLGHNELISKAKYKSIVRANKWCDVVAVTCDIPSESFEAARLLIRSELGRS